MTNVNTKQNIVNKEAHVSKLYGRFIVADAGFGSSRNILCSVISI